MSWDEWQLTTLGEIALDSQGFVDGPFGSALTASEYEEQVQRPRQWC
jgi:hypothetical protein